MNPYLQATQLCNFDTAPEIRKTALEITAGIQEDRQKAAALAAFVKEIKYAYDEWYITASETLARKEGMCSSKTNLMVAMLRSLDIPAGYRLLRISAETELFRYLFHQDPAITWTNYVNQQNHVITEILLQPAMSLDLSKDSLYEKGLRKIGIPPEIKLDDEHPRLVASFDDWMHERYLKRINSQHPIVDLAVANRQLDRIREIGAGL
ncbi:MAG: transglutaminase-like domain-containing protein [Dehalococcoidales bacterium]|nr:transglutaminase-like domain-containing protein [Dehalococcoidales bacterium]